jgi:hypothetical protein
MMLPAPHPKPPIGPKLLTAMVPRGTLVGALSGYCWLPPAAACS